MSTALIQIQLRRGTAAAWTTANPTLAESEIGVETDTGFTKTGDGTTAWTSLTYDQKFGNDITVTNDALIGASVTIGEEIVMDEQADHTATPATGKGIWWTRDDGVPMFTDESGADFELNASGGPDFLLMGA